MLLVLCRRVPGRVGLSPTQHSLTTQQNSRTASTQKHATLNTAHGTQPRSPQQATAPVRPARTPLLPTPQRHTDTHRPRDGEGGDWQTDVNKHARMADRHTRRHILAALHKHTPQSTAVLSTRSHLRQTQHIVATTVGCVWVGWGVRSLGGRTRRVPCHSHGQGGGRHSVEEPRSMV